MKNGCCCRLLAVSLSTSVCCDWEQLRCHMLTHVRCPYIHSSSVFPLEAALRLGKSYSTVCNIITHSTEHIYIEWKLKTCFLCLVHHFSPKLSLTYIVCIFGSFSRLELRIENKALWAWTKFGWTAWLCTDSPTSRSAGSTQQKRWDVFFVGFVLLSVVSLH